jgi:outer membrane protein assembly factor BamB
VNKLIILIIGLFFLNNCSFNEKSSFWQNKDKDKELKNKANVKKVFSEDKKIIVELNPELKIDLTNIITSNKITENNNNYGFQNYSGLLNKIGNYKFSKLENINILNYKPIFLNDGLIFFDKKGSIIRYSKNQKIKWKNNYYSKAEKKLKPKLHFKLDGENLLVADNIAKYYSININSGKLNWLKSNIYPFNSEIKKYNNKIYVVDYKNTLRCYNINDGSECWNLQTEDSFTISNSNYSLIVDNNMVIFSNSIGDITAVDIVTGLITWQLPTQSSSIINETYYFKNSKLVSDGNSIFFSNNKNKFYSIDLKTGTTNWTNKINSIVTPIISGNLLFTVSNEGYLFVLEKNKGDIIRITDLFKNYKIKKRKTIEPVGFSIGNNNLYLTNTDGNIIVADLSFGKVTKIEKVSGNFFSKPFIFNQNLFVIRDGSILQYN